MKSTLIDAVNVAEVILENRHKNKIVIDLLKVYVSQYYYLQREIGFFSVIK